MEMGIFNFLFVHKKVISVATSEGCLFEKVKSLMKDDNLSELSILFKYLKRKFDKQQIVKNVFDLVGKQVFRDTKVEFYFPDIIRSENFIALSSFIKDFTFSNKQPSEVATEITFLCTKRKLNIPISIPIYLFINLLNL